jgi:Type I phosphodiesterase / nucleotide pyrophosphatase
MMTDPLAAVSPRYGRGSLADILPGTLAALDGRPGPAALAGLMDGPLAGVRRVAILLVDGLGWHQMPLVAARGTTFAEITAGRLGTSGVLTAGFPSTTPTSLVSLGAGVAPGAHGILGFTLRIPGTDRVLNHVRWANGVRWADGVRCADEPDPLVWQPVATQFDLAAAAGTTVRVVSRPEFAGSGLTVAAYGSAPFRAAATAEELATVMLTELSAAPAPALVYGYHPDLDKAGHLYGVASAQWRAEAAVVDRLVTRLADGLAADTALIVTADHGQLDVPMAGRIDCDADPRLGAGVEVVSGEPRVRYLHARPGAVGDVAAAWREILGEAASVVARDEAIAAGWFGPIPEAHLQRIGDVVVACRDRHVVLASRREPELLSRFIGFHGSTTAAEMEIPLVIIRPVG